MATRTRGGGSRTVTRGGQTRTETRTETQTNVVEDEDRIYLDCPFEDKEKVKKLGAKWDPNSKRWYIPGGAGVNTDKFAQWLPGGRGRKLNAGGGGDGDPEDNSSSAATSSRRGRGGCVRQANNNFQTGPRPLFQASAQSGCSVSDAEALRMARLARFGLAAPVEQNEEMGEEEEPEQEEEQDNDDESDVSESILQPVPKPPSRSNTQPSGSASAAKAAKRTPPKRAVEDSDDDSDISESLFAPRPKKR